MTKTQKISVINTLFNEETTLNILKNGGITDKKTSLLSKRVNRPDVKAVYVDGVHKVLPLIIEAVANYTETLRLVDQEAWDYYALMEFDNLETRALKTAIKMLKDAWKKLPKFRKAEHVKKQSR